MLAFCALPNHWHLVVWPQADGDLSEYLRWLTVTHTQRWHAHYQTAGTGPLYQGRFKSCPVQADDHFLTVVRYVERNPLRAGLVKRAEEWRWCSLWHRLHHTDIGFLDTWPVPVPVDWVAHVNGVETAAELEAVCCSLVRGAPFGLAAWQQQTARKLGLESTLRPLGRPRKEKRDEP